MPAELTQSDTQWRYNAAEASSGADGPTLLASVRRHPWLVAACVGGATVSAALALALLPPTYRTTALLRIDDARLKIAEVVERPTQEGSSPLATELVVLGSRMLRERVAADLRLQVRLVAPRGLSRDRYVRVMSVDRVPSCTDVRLGAGGQSAQPGDTVRACGVLLIVRAVPAEGIRLAVEPLHLTLRDLSADLVVERSAREADVVTVRYASQDSVLAASVPNALVTSYLAQRRERREAPLNEATRFLEQQTGQVSSELLKLEHESESFRKAQRTINLPEEARSAATRLASVTAERDRLQSEQAGLEQLIADVRARVAEDSSVAPSQFRRLTAHPAMVRQKVATELVSALAAEEARLGELRQRRTGSNPEVQVVERRVREISANILDAARTYTVGLGRELAALQAQRAELAAYALSVPAAENQLDRLQRRRGVLSGIETQLQQRAIEASIAASAADPGAALIDPAVAASDPLRPLRTLPIAALVGLLLGTGTAVWREGARRTIRTRDELERALRLPVLALIPRLRGARHGVTECLDSQPGVEEAFGQLGVNLDIVMQPKPKKVVMFTSATVDEGKTLIATTYAVQRAREGARVLVIDADLRAKETSLALGLVSAPGITDVVAGRSTLVAAISETEQGGVRVAVLPAGMGYEDPVTVIRRFVQSDELAQALIAYDVVIVDTPPLNLLAESTIMAGHVDAVVLTARFDRSDKQETERALAQLRLANAPVVGAVLTDVPRAGMPQGYVDSGYGVFQRRLRAPRA